MGIGQKLGLGAMILVLGVGGGIMGKQELGVQAAIQHEQSLEKSEVQECTRRLQLIQKGWAAYKKDHDGAEPPSIEGLIPKYIPSAKLLMCPTAERWEAHRGVVEQGKIQLGKRTYPETYAFIWLTPNYQRFAKTGGDTAPIAACYTHREVMYRVAYHHKPHLDAFGEASLPHLRSEVRAAGVLEVRQNGKVDRVTSELAE